jgi:hypothetical protein
MGKSRECSEQAEKMMARRDDHMVASGVKPAVGWTNHYSPKYDKCFVSAIYFSGDGKETPFSSTVLMDAFERNIVATYASVGPTQGFCDVEEQKVDCASAKAFLDEHMKR